MKMRDELVGGLAPFGVAGMPDDIDLENGRQHVSAIRVKNVMLQASERPAEPPLAPPIRLAKT